MKVVRSFAAVYRDRCRSRIARSCLTSARLAAFVAAALVFWAGQGSLSAQLAITEVMSSAATTHQGVPVISGPDFWELTNFGSETIDLTDYRFRDAGDFDCALPAIFERVPEAVRIAPGESIVCVRSVGTNEETERLFREWWGPDRLPPALQIFVYPRPFGFASEGEVVQLWKAPDCVPEEVDSVAFPAVDVNGITFTFDSNSGTFGVPSSLEEGAMRAAKADDIGSPGRSKPAVALRITEQPKGGSVCLGARATLSVQALGLPRPRYQWLREGIPIPSGTSSRLIIPSVQSEDAGVYEVVVRNGLQTQRSLPARLQVMTDRRAPVILTEPADATITLGQSATFSVETCALPQPTFQWSHNGEDIPHATTASFTLTGATFADSGDYSVHVRNELGELDATARLWVERKPRLYITEIMAAPSTNTPALDHRDWWELTNLDDHDVDLFGYRWDDTLIPSFTGGPTITNHVILHAGESVIFVDNMTRESFVRWWGARNLPPQLQVISYHGNGLDDMGEAIRVWNATATYLDDFICSVSFAAAEIGVSYWFDAEVAFFGELSIPGERGAFVAAEGGDTGSPGWNGDHAVPLRLDVQWNPKTQAMTLSWPSVAGGVYQVLATSDLSSPAWKSLGSVKADGAEASKVVSWVPGASPRFFKVIGL